MTDEELYAAMTELYQEQQRCLALQRKLMFASAIFFVVGFIPLFAEILVGIIWGECLAKKGDSLVRYKYRFVLHVPLVSMPNERYFWRPYYDAAKREGDELSIQIMEFRHTSVIDYPVRALLGYGLALMILATICEITGIEFKTFFSFLP